MTSNRLHSKHLALIVFIFLALLLVCVVSSLVFGARPLSLREIWEGISMRETDAISASILHKRLIRTVFGLCCGAALGIAGVLMQSVTRNPLADPSILGVNMGAALFVVCGMAFFQISSPREFIWFALAGALLTAIFVFGIGSMGRSGATPLKLVLAGAATSAALSSLVTAVMIPRSFVMNQFRFWQVGSIGAGTWDSILLLLPFLLAGAAVAVACIPGLNALALGDETAKGLGVRTGTLRLTAAFAGVILCGATTAVAGPIAFVGLLASHMIRLLMGPDLRVLLPMSALSGAVILIMSDVIGRWIGRPGELEVGVVTAFVGAPLLIIMAMKAKVRAI
jgi:iron complex transport system permease protein